ncbi:hypothetical protein D3C72_1883670 [compost metagenome]
MIAFFFPVAGSIKKNSSPAAASAPSRLIKVFWPLTAATVAAQAFTERRERVTISAADNFTGVPLLFLRQEVVFKFFDEIFFVKIPR